MAKRNLNEVLGFISRWGDSRFSSRLMESEASPKEERDALDKRIKQVQVALKASGEDPEIKAELNKLEKEYKIKDIDFDDRMNDWTNKKTAADKRDKDEAEVENALNASPEPPTTIPNILKKVGKTIIGRDELAGGIEGTEEKPSRMSNILGKVSSFAGKAGEIGGALGAISSIGTTLSQGAIKMGRAQTGKRDVMGASVGGLTQTISGVSSGMDRIGVAADRLEDERQIKDATRKIEAQMRGLKSKHGNLSSDQKKIATEKYTELEKQRNALRSGNKFHAARLHRMLDLLNTGRTTPKSGGSPNP